MKSSIIALLVTFTTSIGFAACGGSTASNPATGQDSGVTTDDGGATDDSGDMPDAADETPPPLDHGKPSTTYPAFKPYMGQLTDVVGSVLTAPVIVPVTWETDPLVTQLEAFSDGIGASDYWKAAVMEYGVGAATAGAHVHMPVNGTTPLPTSLSQSQLDTLVANSAADPTTSGWPAPTGQTIYILYLHPNTILNFGGGQSACNVGVGGYHTSTQSTGVSYAIVPRCQFRFSALDETTSSASHELGEAATDPSPNSSPAYIGFEPAYFAWELFQAFNVENGDACEFYQDSFYTSPAPFAFKVQRLWSNASGAAGHNPCVPLQTGAYFNTTPTMLENITVDQSRIGGSPVAQSKGFKIPLGTTKTFPIGFYSDAASGPWSIRATEGDSLLVGGTATHNLDISIDRTSGQNGEIAYVTVTVNKAGSTIGGQAFTKANFITILSSLGGTTHYMPILITN